MTTMSPTQIGLFVRHTPDSVWEWVGFFPNPEQANLAFNALEIEHPELDAVWINPQQVFTSMTVSKEMN